MSSIEHTQGPINITIGQSWCGFSNKQKKANEDKDNVHTFMCGDEDDDKDTIECKRLAPGLPAFPANFQCVMDDGELKCKAPKLGYDDHFGEEKK